MPTNAIVRKLGSRQGRPVVSQRLPRKVEVNLKHMKMSDLQEISCGLKDSNITALRLFCSGPDCEILRFSATDPTTSHILTRFFRELAEALGIGGWLKHLELGFKPWKRNLSVLSQAIGCSTTLQRLSFANSSLGDAGLKLLAQGLCNCPPLQILDLSGCALSDSSHVSLASVLKASVSLNAEAVWQSSLRGCESGKVRTKIPGLALHRGLYALDISFNFLSDASAKHICNILRLGVPLAALNLQGNQMQRKSMKRFLTIFEMWGILRMVDLRGNMDRKGVGVLENGEHLSFFSVPHEPFWKTDGSNGGTQILRGFLNNSQVLKKELSPSSRNGSGSSFKVNDHPPVNEATTLMENQVLSSSRRSLPTSEMKHNPRQGAGVLSLSPLRDGDTESADLIPTTILPSSCCKRKSELPCALGSKNNTTHLGIASRPLSPRNYLSTPKDYSDYMHLCEDNPDVLSIPVDLTCDLDCCCTSVSTDDTQMTDVSLTPESPSNRIYDQSLQKPQTHAAQYNKPVHQHSLDWSNCRLSKPGRQYPYDGNGLEKQTSAASTQFRAELPEASHDDSEWDAFMNDMSRKLLHVQDALELVISSGKPDFLITTQTTMTTLQEGLQQLLALET